MHNQVSRKLIAACIVITGACESPAPVVMMVPPPPPPLLAIVVPPAAPPMPVAVALETTRRLQKETLGALCARLSVGTDDSNRALAALHPLLDARRMRPSDVVTVRLENNRLARLSIQRFRDDGVPQEVEASSDGKGGFVAHAMAPEVRTEEALVQGTVQGTLYDTMVAQHETPQLINQFVDVFNSQVDFYREVQNGDTFRLVVEKRFAGDRFIGYGRVLAAEYRQDRRTLRGFWWAGGDGKGGHFDDNGRSTLTAFLKTPMEFTRITSSFGTRFHPVLKEKKAHNGVDYGAATGTPVWTIGDGRVLTAGKEGACGNMVLIQHPNGIQTGYCHFSRIAAGVRVGAHVSQKQIIGYVGTTGRSTGPHLHFLMKRAGTFLNPRRIEAPRRTGLSGAELAKFRQTLPDLLLRMDATPRA